MLVSVFAPVALLCLFSAVVQCSDRSDGKALDYRYIMLQSINCANKGNSKYKDCVKAEVKSFPYDTKKVLETCQGNSKHAGKDSKGPAILCDEVKYLLKDSFNIVNPAVKIMDMEANKESKEYFLCIQKAINSNLKDQKTYDDAIINSDTKIRDCLAKNK